MERDNRKEYIDIAKGIGIFIIVLSHVCRAGTQTRLRMYCVSFSPDVFFLLSGLTFMGIRRSVFCEAEERRFVAFIRSRFERILVPYYLWALISIAIYLILGKYAGAEPEQMKPGKNLLAMLYGNANTGYFEWNKPLWFLPCLISSSIAWYYIIRFGRKLNVRNGNIYILTAMLVSVPIGYLYNTFCPKLFLPFHFESAIYAMPVFGTGLLIREYSLTHKPAEEISWSVTVIFCVLGLALCAWLGIFDTHISLMHGTFNGYFRALAIRLIQSLSVLLLAIKISHCRLLSYIGQRSFAILLMHKFPILFFQNVIPGAERLFEKGFRFRAASEIVLSVVTIALCLVVERPVSRIAPFLIGEKRKQK